PPAMDDKDTQPQPERSERETPSSQTPEAAASGALVEPPEAAVTRLETELGQLKDRYLRLAAEYDNFRKRIQKERTELWQRGQADTGGAGSSAQVAGGSGRARTAARSAG